MINSGSSEVLALKATKLPFINVRVPTGQTEGQLTAVDAAPLGSVGVPVKPCMAFDSRHDETSIPVGVHPVRAALLKVVAHRDERVFDNPVDGPGECGCGSQDADGSHDSAEGHDQIPLLY